MAKDRGLRNRKTLSNAIQTEIWMALDELSRTTRINKSRLLDEAIVELLKKHNKLDLLEKYKKEISE